MYAINSNMTGMPAFQERNKRTQSAKLFKRNSMSYIHTRFLERERESEREREREKDVKQ